ncbi:restriction endonuclease FokI C-terminal domain-containing protein [Mycobacterium paraintracellulare]|uniref:restriction endonuclease FokI C-terminal domain-containing protein n=1 Tax=Mycobacterium paraintracellulare TaxID=1138383 RepID=UPI001EEE62C4|nr:restriction endonuclease FokI C-terminal domain-containing protein [Mycobacterium paraintracellulare]WVL48860.1 restriction endonuclease FokI C-terminal domain-containing protein [Mycobacterium paraintracellulare]
MTETGSRVIDFQQSGSYDEIVVESKPLWRRRTVRARIATAKVSQEHVDQLAEASALTADVEAVLFAPHGVEESVLVPHGMFLVSAEQLIALLERSSMVVWQNHVPTPAYDRVEAQRELDHNAFLLDPVGLRWLPSLSRNEYPPDLEGQSASPDTLFERMTFRLFTSCLRFGGERYGEAGRGKRQPDAVLMAPGSDHYSILLDCKASADGFVMEADDHLRFCKYIDLLRERLDASGYPIRYMLVLSSAFPGRAGDSHPFYARAIALKDDKNVALAYVTADVLARTATQVEMNELSPENRESLTWDSVFATGLVKQSDVETRLGL